MKSKKMQIDKRKCKNKKNYTIPVRLNHRSVVVAKYNAIDTSLATFPQHSS